MAYNVSMVSSADEALEVVRTLSLDLIFVDVMLDGLPGDELLAQLRKLVPADVAIVMASQLSQMEVVKKCLDLGADGYLVKPIHTSTIQLSWQYAYRKKGLRGSPQLQPQTMEPFGEFRLDAQTTSSRHADASIPAPGVPLSESAGSASEVAPRDRFRSVRPIRVRDLSSADGAGLAARLGHGQGSDGEVGACAPQ
uniref:Response regulatory domain-containing protein n=1 Tax=Haptolina ericina TaxID=156174 RepID=A0A7S3FDM2_9EUKA